VDPFGIEVAVGQDRVEALAARDATSSHSVTFWKLVK
jgi:hypothetical protein